MAASRGGAVDLFERGDSRADLVDAVLPQRLHPERAGGLADLVERAALADALDEVVVRHEQFVDADPPGVAEVAAAGAALGAEDRVGGFAEALELALLVGAGLVRLL